MLEGNKCCGRKKSVIKNVGRVGGPGVILKHVTKAGLREDGREG